MKLLHIYIIRCTLLVAMLCTVSWASIKAQTQVATPTFAWNGEQLTMATETEGADIYYSMSRYSAEPTGDGSEANPFNVAAAIAKCKEIGETASTATYYIKGIVSQITNQYGVEYGNATFNISDNGSNQNFFIAYRVLYIGNQKYTDGQQQVQVGDDVVICGKLVNYKGNTPETVQNEAYLVSMNTPELTTKYESPITVPGNTVVRAKATKQGMTDSEVVMASTGIAAYAALNDDNTVLTFYYDDQKNTRNGMDIGPFTLYFNNADNTHSVTGRPWESNASTITTVIFDESLANYTQLINMVAWFTDFTKLTTIQGLNYLNTEKVTDMSGLFWGCSSLRTLDLSTFNTSNVTSMWSMFDDCTSLTSLNISTFNTSKVTDMRGMFYGCSSLTTLNLSHFDTSNVVYFNSMFRNCSNLTSVNVGSFNTGNAEVIQVMFGYCPKLTTLNLSSFNTTKVANMVSLFGGCTSLETIIVGSGWVVNNTGTGGTTTDIGENMFYGCTSLKGGKGTVYDDTHTGSEYARIDNAPDAPGYFTDGSSVANFEMFSVDKSVTYVPNQPITATPSIVMTPGNDAEWMTDLDIGLTNLDTGESTEVLEFNASRYYSSSTETFTFKNAMRGTLNPRDGELTTNSETGEVNNTGSMYIPGYRNLPRTGGFIAFEALQNGSLHVPIRVTEDKSLYVVGDDGNAITDILFKDGDGHTLSLLTDPLCAVAHNYVMGFVSFNVEAGRKYYVFCNASKARFAGYVFSKEAITIAPETMANVRDILQPAPINDLELFAVDATTKVTPNVAVTATRSVRMTPGNDAEWNPRLLESSSVSLSFNANNYYPSSTSTYTFWGGLSGATPAKDGELTEGQSTGVDYDYKSKNLPHSGSYVTYESVQDGSLIIPLHVPLNKPLYVVDSNGKVNTDIQFLNDQNQAEVMLAEPLCVFSETEAVSGFLSFNVKQGEKYTIFINGGVDLRYGGYVFSTEPISINPATMERVKGILEGSSAEPYAVLSENNTVLTFYYDDQKTAKNGMDVGPFDYYSKERRGWSPYTSQITKAVFDQSFDQCTTLTSTAFWFTFMDHLETIEHIEYLHTDNVEDMNCMFDSCYVLRDLDVSHFVTAKVKNMQCMFNRCEALTSLNLSNFNTSSCTFMRGMFYDCKGLSRLDLTNFNTLKNTSTECMFELCSSLESITFGSGFSTENVTSMGWMFQGCSALKNIDVSKFNTSNVTDMGEMFLACTSLTSLDVSGFNTQQVTNMQDMFRACTNLTSLDLSKFNTQNVTEMYGMFYNCTNLKSLDLSNFDTRNVRNMDHLFRFCTNLVNLNISGFSTANGASQRNMFEGCSSLASIQAGNAVIADSTYAQIGNPNLLLYVNEASQAPQSVKNVVVLDAAEQIVLTDMAQGNNNFYCPKQFRAKSISYTRNFKQTTQVGVSRGWETIALPFAVQTITHEKNGTLTPFGVEGGKPFWLKELTENGLVSAQRIDAYAPYLISMPNNSIYPDDYNQAGQVTFSATNAVVPVTESRETSGNNRTLIPTMMSVAQSPDIYVINRDTTYQNNPQGSIFVADYREVRPFEAYVKHVGGARYFSLSEIPQLDVTGIESIELQPWKGEQWWTLDGRKLNRRPSKKGIYIRNGKKVVVDATF